MPFDRKKSALFAAELVVDKAMELRYIGGVYAGNIKPAPFLCLVLKMLQIQPEKDIVVEFIKNEDFKYVRALGAFYLRLTGSSMDCYKYLEPLLNDYRKVRTQGRDGKFVLSHMDEFIDDLLTSDRSCDVILPRIQKRHVLEGNATPILLNRVDFGTLAKVPNFDHRCSFDTGLVCVPYFHAACLQKSLQSGPNTRKKRKYTKTGF